MGTEVKTEEQKGFLAYTKKFEDRKEDIRGKETSEKQESSQSPCETW